MTHRAGTPFDPVGRVAGFLLAGVLLAACTTTTSTSTTESKVTPSVLASGTTRGGGPTTSSTTSRISTTTTPATIPPAQLVIEVYPVPAGSRPHDVAPALHGGVWFTAQGSGHLGLLDPSTGDSEMVPLGPGSRPHGVIVGPDGRAWVTDGGLNAIVSVEPDGFEVKTYPVPRSGANLNTASFDGSGVLWFTGQGGIYGYLDPATEVIEVYDAPIGRGPYGMATDPRGAVWYASLAGSHIARVAPDGGAEVVFPPTEGQGARRLWSDSRGAIWVSEWNSGNLTRYQPDEDVWAEWRLPGDRPAPYAVYVDHDDVVWLSDFSANALVRFDPRTEEFLVLELPGQPGNVRQILGRPGEVWGAESAADTLIVVRTR
jgi:virginiamycin B lyase